MSGYYDYDDGPGGPVCVRLIGFIAAGVVALCLAFIIGYSVHGGGDTTSAHGDAPARPATSTQSSSGSSNPAARAAPAATPRGPLSRNSAGVIVGYSHDQEGAVAAAGNYTAALYIQKNRTHSRELTVLTSIAATPADAARMAGDFSSEDAALAKLLDVADLQTPGVIAYGHPLGYRVESVTDTAATIDVYVAGGQGMADAPSDSSATGETFYEVDQVQLVWRSTAGGPAGHGDWQMSNWSHLVQNNGPELATVAAQGYLPFPIGQTSQGSSS
jgi:hypothetical protein